MAMASEIDLFPSQDDFVSRFISINSFVCAGCLRSRTTVGSLCSTPDGWFYGLCGPCDKALQSPAVPLSDREAKAEQIMRNLAERPVKTHAPRVPRE